VALARTVVAEAPICLMDEPLSNLDAKLRAEMRRDAGLNPDVAPATWAGQVEFARRLTRREGTRRRSGASRSPPPASPTGCSRG
jgi:hypothetical protein